VKEGTLRHLLNGRDIKGNTPFHIAARMTGVLGSFLKEFVDLYPIKVWLIISFLLFVQELTLKNEADQNPVHISAKNGNTCHSYSSKPVRKP